MHVCHSGLVPHCWWIQQSEEIEGVLVSFIQISFNYLLHFTYSDKMGIKAYKHRICADTLV